MKFYSLRTIVAATLLAGGVALAAAQDKTQDEGAVAQRATPSDAEVVAQQKPSYPLTTCPVSGEKLGSMGDAVDHVIDGRLVRLCCKMCVKSVEKDSEAVFAKIDEAVIRVQKPLWPASITACPVSGEAYGGEMGEPVDHVYGTRYVKLCCKGCKRELAKNPAKYFATIDRAMIEDQRKSYPLTTCPISGKELGDSPKDVLYGVTLVRFCCPKCPTAFEKNPEPVLQMVTAARKEKAGAGAKGATGAAGGL